MRFAASIQALFAAAVLAWCAGEALMKGKASMLGAASDRLRYFLEEHVPARRDAHAGAVPPRVRRIGQHVRADGRRVHQDVPGTRRHRAKARADADGGRERLGFRHVATVTDHRRPGTPRRQRHGPRGSSCSKHRDALPAQIEPGTPREESLEVGVVPAPSAAAGHGGRES